MQLCHYIDLYKTSNVFGDIFSKNTQIKLYIYYWGHGFRRLDYFIYVRDEGRILETFQHTIIVQHH